MTDPPPHHLVAAQEFAGDRFWSAADRLAARLGHGDHSRQLLGEVERLNHYALHCVSCGQAIATFEVQPTSTESQLVNPG
jgi:hypothetical protein